MARRELKRRRLLVALLLLAIMVAALAARKPLHLAFIHVFPGVHIRGATWEMHWDEDTEIADGEYFSGLFPLWRFTSEGWLESDGVCGAAPADYRTSPGKLSLHDPHRDIWHEVSIAFPSSDRMRVTSARGTALELRRRAEEISETR